MADYTRIHSISEQKLFIYFLVSIYKNIVKITHEQCYHLAFLSFVTYNLEDEFSIVSNNFMATNFPLPSIKGLVADYLVYFAGSSE